LLRTNDGDRSAKDSPIKTLRNGVEKSGKLEAKAGGKHDAAIPLCKAIGHYGIFCLHAAK
jgi:hypothetical protein